MPSSTSGLMALDGDPANPEMLAEFGLRHQPAGLVDEFADLDLAPDGFAHLDVQRRGAGLFRRRRIAHVVGHALSVA